ncbi:MAG: sigma-70 family RNA polymerase sigma factor [Desulfamplus sp.]|nr:sigma-70 family RNA polymerase sigma factor [Desulfamplus sp.]
MTHENEEELIRKLKQGSQGAFESLFDKYHKRILAIAWGITLDREESLEIAQDVFVSVYQNIHTFRGDSGLMTWMRKITVNICLNWKRKWIRRLRWSHHSIDQGEIDHSELGDPGGVTPEESYIELEFQHLLMDHVALLPEKMRTVFVLSVIENLSCQEIADTLGIKTGTVRSRLHNARRHLSQAIEGIIEGI